MFVQRKKYKTDRNVHHVQQQYNFTARKICNVCCQSGNISYTNLRKKVKIDRQIKTVWLPCKTTILPGCKPPSATLCGSVISPGNKTWIMPDAHICQTQYTILL
ncbi:hypothetical protein T06_15146 [Trichinella sp. T6]|nr:hypothetical protein T06_15146 [Trichinella sp. T6]